MNNAMMKYLLKRMANNVQLLEEVIKDSKSFNCEECFGTNFEMCESTYPNAILMIAGGKESYLCCGYCRANREREKYKKDLCALVFEIGKSLDINDVADVIRIMREHALQHDQFVKTLIRTVIFYANPHTHVNDIGPTHKGEGPGQMARDTFHRYAAEIAQYGMLVEDDEEQQIHDLMDGLKEDGGPSDANQY